MGARDSVITDPIFWLCAVIAVIVTGISKGGFGGLGLLAVPLMALVISPVQAAGIMLPILIIMDWVSLWAYRKHYDKALLWLTLPGAIIGIVIGGLLTGYVNDRFVLICVGVIALLFPLYAIFKPKGRASVMKGSRPLGIVAGCVAGFTSFIAHAGGPPYQAYAIPQELEKRRYAGTAVIFFAVVNAIKLIPYAMLGQFGAENIKTSLMLMPLAPLGVLIGVWLIKRIDQALFYKILYALIFMVGLKLLYDGFVS